MTIEPPNPEATDAPPSWRHIAAWTVAVVAVVYSVSWLGTAFFLKHQAAAWIALQQTNGLTIQSEPLDIGGFPGRIHVAARAVSATSSGWAWRADKVRLKAWPLGLWRFTIDVSGRQSLMDEVPAWLTADTMEMALRLDLNGRLREAVLTAAGVNAGLLEGQSLSRLQSGTVALDLLKPEAPTADSPTLPVTSRIAVDLKGLALPLPLPSPLDQPIERAAATVEITGPVMDGPLPQVLEAWRSGGGTVEVREAVLSWPPLHMSGNGTVALDNTLQPEGAFSLKFQGGVETLDAFAAGGVMARDEAEIAKMGLTLLSRRSVDGAPEINVPLTLQDRRLSAGPVTLMTLPEIAWRAVTVP
jgi:hypothetical protein